MTPHPARVKKAERSHDRGIWHSAWFVHQLDGKEARLHLVPGIPWWDGKKHPGLQDEACCAPGAIGEALCGRGSRKNGGWNIPGVFDRLGLERCRLCCDAAEFPWGFGTPGNEQAQWTRKGKHGIAPKWPKPSSRKRKGVKRG